MIDWMFENNGWKDTSSTLAVDLVFNGELPWSLPGGAIGWAFGGQYRDEAFERDVNFLTDIDQNPCVDTPINGNTGCTTKFGVFTFFGPLRNQDLTRDVFGVFGEVNLPLLESLQAQVAAALRGLWRPGRFHHESEGLAALAGAGLAGVPWLGRQHVPRSAADAVVERLQHDARLHERGRPATSLTTTTAIRI